MINLPRYFKRVDREFDSDTSFGFAAAIPVIKVFDAHRSDGKTVVVKPVD